MPQWEYWVAPVLEHKEKMILDIIGKEGWELVQIINGVGYFKRPKQETAPEENK